MRNDKSKASGMTQGKLGKIIKLNEGEELRSVNGTHEKH